MMNSNLSKFLASFTFLLLAGFAFAAPVHAAPNVSLSPASQTIIQNNQHQLTVSINAEQSDVFGADVILVSPSADIDVTSVGNGGFLLCINRYGELMLV